MQAAQASFLRRYRDIVVAILLFVTIDIALIAYNLVASFQIDAHTAGRDLSGNIRSSSQIVIRDLLEISSDQAAGKTIDQNSLKTLKERSQLIQDGLKVLREGGTLAIGGESVRYTALKTPREVGDLDKLDAIWGHYQQTLQPVLASTSPDPAALATAVAYARANNNGLLDAVNDLVDSIQDRARAETRLLRFVQEGGALLALANFLFTALLAMRRLRASDAAAARSQKETADILATVKEGLFLVTPDYRIGEQMSGSLKDVLRRDVKAGTQLFDLLEPLLNPQVREAARDYVELLFGKRVKESLVYSLNPLSEVALDAGNQGRFLSFQFNRVLEGEDVAFLLVTVQDATERMELKAQLDAAKTRTRAEMEVLLRVLSNDPGVLQDFLRRSEAALEQINDGLRQASRRAGENYLSLVNSIFRSVHGIKSEAAALNLEMFENIAHNFEVDLITLRDRGDAEGADMVKLTLHLDDLFECVSSVRGFLDRIAGGGASPAAAQRVAPSAQLSDALNSLARRISGEHGKQVKVAADLELYDNLPAGLLEELRGISLQLLRNAVVHGIETPDERARHGKPAGGVVRFTSRLSDGGDSLDFRVRDDGRGISPRRLRDALLKSGRYGADEIEAMPDREVVLKIFEPGVSTVVDANRDAGHGTGMDLVLNRVNALGGQINVGSQGHVFTEFRLRIPLPDGAAATPGANA